MSTPKEKISEASDGGAPHITSGAASANLQKRAIMYWKHFVIDVLLFIHCNTATATAIVDTFIQFSMLPQWSLVVGLMSSKLAKMVGTCMVPARMHHLYAIHA